MMKILDAYGGEAYIWKNERKNLENCCDCKELFELKDLKSILNTLESRAATLFHFSEETRCPDLRNAYEKESYNTDKIWELYDSHVSFFEEIGRIEAEQDYLLCTRCELPVVEVGLFRG